MEMTLVNLTKYDATIRFFGQEHVIKPDGTVAHVDYLPNDTGGVGLKVIGLPAPVPGVWFIVSSTVHGRSPGRKDLLVAV